MTYIHVYTRRNGEGQNLLLGKSPPQKEEEGDKVVPPSKSSFPGSEESSDVEADPRPLKNVPPLWKKQWQGYK